VVFAKDVRAGWGNVVIIRHNYRETDGSIRTIDSLYGHLQAILVREGQQVRRGDQIGKIGNNRGMYDAHLHFEIHKNLGIGVDRAQFARDYSNYYSPREFITSHQVLKGGVGGYPMAMNTFTARPDRMLFAPVDDAKLSPGEARAMRAGYSRSKKKSGPSKKKRYAMVEPAGSQG
jgi:murein DD-endopeptidase MepM/ murein hydrolase activator NlpD